MLNEETTVEVIEEEETTTDEDQTETKEKDWKAEALKYKAILDRKAKKAEAAPQAETKSDGFGYDVKAYLKASGIKASEFDFVQSEFKNSGVKDVDALLENEYFQAKLEKQREINRTQDAIPKGKGSNGVAIDSVDYWLAKPFAEVPSHLRRDVLKAKESQEKNRGKFYNS